MVKLKSGHTPVRVWRDLLMPVSKSVLSGFGLLDCNHEYHGLRKGCF